MAESGTVGVVQFLDELVAKIVDDLIVGGATHMAAEAATLMPLMLWLYIIFWGYRMLGGVAPTRSLVLELVKVMMVLLLVLNFEHYNRFVKEPLFALPEYLAAVAIGADLDQGVVALMDEVLTTGFRVGGRYWSEASLFSGDLGLYFVAILIWVSVAVPAAFAAFLLILSKLYIGVLLVFGPLVIALTLFPRTSGYFERWLAEIVTRSLTIAFAVLVPKILLFYFEQNLSEIEASFQNGNTAFATAIVVLFFSIVQILFYWQVPTVASALGGGFQLAPHGIDRRLHNAMLATPAAVMRFSRATERLAGRFERHAGENPMVAEVQGRRRPLPWA